MRSSRVPWVVLLGLLVGAGVGVVAVTAADQRSGPPARQGGDRAASGQPKSPQAVWTQLVRQGVRQADQGSGSYAVSAGRSRPFPPPLRRGLRETLGDPRPLRLRYEEARLFSTEVGVDVWLLRGHRVVCLVRDRTASAACTTEADAARSGLVLQLGILPRPGAPPSEFLLLGVAPDGVAAARIEGRTGSRQVTVAGNVFAARAKAPLSVRQLIRN